MKKIYLAVIAFLAVFLASCGNANVAGKHFENDQMTFFDAKTLENLGSVNASQRF